MSTAPLVIAHRGASGYLPEHTREAKVLAYGQGTDFLEQDVVASRDGELVVLHDLFLDDVTDVAARFPDRRREDGRHYVIDLDLHELKSLRVVERRTAGGRARAYAERFADDGVAFSIVTLQEEIRLIQGLNRTTGRRVGIYPEIKHPDFHRRHGIDLSVRLLEVLDEHGYRGPDDPAFVQCFDAAELRRCREELGTRLKLAQLVEVGAGPPPSASWLAATAEYAQALGVEYPVLVTRRRGSDPFGVSATPTVAEARSAGLALHPFTFRREAPPLHGLGFEQMLELFFVEIGVAAVFCDHPDIAVRVRDRVTAGPA